MVATLKQVRDFIHRSGHCFIAPVPGESDSADAPGVSRLRLFEDGVEIGPPHSSHSNIEREGGGRFSHWDGHLYFSSSDASLPTKNNKPYHVLVEQNSDSRTEIDKGTFLALQSGVMKYPYKDILCCKSPIDMALYQMLIWREKPRTILEIGTLKGGSALWFADLLRSYGIDGHVHSLDITPEPKISDPMVRFYRGDILDLGATWPTDWFASLPR